MYNYIFFVFIPDLPDYEIVSLNRLNDELSLSDCCEKTPSLQDAKKRCKCCQVLTCVIKYIIWLGEVYTKTNLFGQNLIPLPWQLSRVQRWYVNPEFAPVHSSFSNLFLCSIKKKVWVYLISFPCGVGYLIFEIKSCLVLRGYLSFCFLGCIANLGMIPGYTVVTGWMAFYWYPYTPLKTILLTKKGDRHSPT